MVGHIIAALRQSPLVQDLEISRWDNAPHHPAISTHPYHKHEGERIDPSIRVSIEDVLAELATRLQSKGQA